MSQFSRHGESFSLSLSIDEAHVLINLVEQLLELLGEGDFQHHYDQNDPFAQLMAMQQEVVAPEDPVLKRLLPNAYADPEAADEFRRYTEPGLRRNKQDSLRVIREELTVLVDKEEAGDFLRRTFVEKFHRKSFRNCRIHNHTAQIFFNRISRRVFQFV